MGYFSDIRITVTKRDYIRMLEKNKENNNICDCFLNSDKAYIKEYEKNGVNCIIIQQYSMKYYKEFKEIQQFEKYLNETKSGYVFVRVGDGWDDIEYKNTAKFKELEVPFKFINIIEEKANKQLLKELNSDIKHYMVNKKQYIFTDKKDILDFYQKDITFIKYIEEQYKKNTQLKLILNLDTTENKALGTLYIRDSNANEYIELKKNYIDINDAVFYLGYPDEISFLEDINESDNEEEFE